jgi:hypothetical protein
MWCAGGRVAAAYDNFSSVSNLLHDFVTNYVTSITARRRVNRLLFGAVARASGQ